MAVTINIDLNRKFIVNGDINTIFSFLSDIPASAEHFPKVHALTALADNTFHWEMEEVGLGTHSIQTSYACQYVSDCDAKTIVWTPIKGEGNSIVSGRLKLTELATGTHVSLKTKAALTLPLPRLFKLAISPMVKLEFSGMVDTYLSNLKNLLVHSELEQITED
ncbi:MAG: carbon monoxide dehydrogenase subunit G [Oleispira sp.]|jgi:carbon monoxide dehydrogenase subunit G